MLDGLPELINYLLTLEGKKWIRLMVGLILLFIVGIIVEATLHSFSAIRHRTDIAILKGLLELEKEGILDSPALGGPYRRLVADYTDVNRLRNLAVIFATSLPTTQEERLWTLAAGAALPFLLGMVSLISSHKERKFAIFIGFLMTTFFSVILGLLSLLILPAIIGYTAIALRISVSPLSICIWIPIVQFSLILIIFAVLKQRKEPPRSSSTSPRARRK